MRPPCGFPACGRWAFDAGCVCYPDDREQDLCCQHAKRATPLGTMVQVADYGGCASAGV